MSGLIYGFGFIVLIACGIEFLMRERSAEKVWEEQYKEYLKQQFLLQQITCVHENGTTGQTSAADYLKTYYFIDHELTTRYHDFREMCNDGTLGDGRHLYCPSHSAFSKHLPRQSYMFYIAREYRTNGLDHNDVCAIDNGVVSAWYEGHDEKRITLWEAAMFYGFISPDEYRKFLSNPLSKMGEFLWQRKFGGAIKISTL